MGTIWTSGSRFEAVSRFLVSQPQGYHLASRGFGSGLPLKKYKQVLCSSIFSLAPEGDRHLDTFRLWESLSCGCIPLVVDYKKTASKLLPPAFPVPIFKDWSAAVSFASEYLPESKKLLTLQSLTYSAWLYFSKT